MQKLIKTIFLTVLFAMAMTSCKNEGSVQTYFVEHQDLPDYKAIDISANIVDFSKADLTEEQKETISSLEKFNVLLYRSKQEDLEKYKSEFAKAKAIFKNEKHNELMEFNTDGAKFRVSSIGSDEAVDEILILASSSKIGFGLVRILGDEMNPEKMIALIDKLQKADVDDNQLEGIMDFFK